MRFKETYLFQARKIESYRIRSKYLDRIPIICEKTRFSKMEQLKKQKYLVPADFTLGQFMYVIRSKLNLPAEKGLFFFVNGTIPPIQKTLSEIDYEHIDEDGFLYITYSDENVFGLDYVTTKELISSIGSRFCINSSSE